MASMLRTIDVRPRAVRIRSRAHPGVRRSTLAWAAVWSVTLLAVALWRFGPARAAEPEPAPSVLPVGAVAVPQERTADEEATIDLFRRASPSVVGVTNLAFVRDRFRRSATEMPQGTGSGFLWDEEGHVVTNYHVIRNNQALRVSLGDRETYEADVVGFARNQDIAVLKLRDAPRGRLRGLRLGTSTHLSVGQSVYAIGNPFGLDRTLTTGVISGLGRKIQAESGATIEDVIQTDAAINPGNSGGPLLDSGGRLIGVNTAIVSPSGAYAGVGFAVPVDVVREVVPQLILHGSVTRPGLGVLPMEDWLSSYLELDGVGIDEVRAGTSADKAGLRSARRYRDGSIVLDEILAVGADRVRNERELREALGRRHVGEQVTLRVRRAEGIVEVPVRLQAIE